jgi:hypothetical protein
MRADAICKAGWALVVAACNPAIAQPAFEPAARDTEQTQVIDRIREIQTRDGNNTAELIVPFTELALLYEQTADPALANAALDQTLYLIRVNQGLHSLDQAPLLQRAIRNDEASGDFASAWRREEELVVLARRHPEDLRTVPIFHEVADRRMALFERWMAGENPQQMIEGDYCGVLGCSRAPAARTVLGDAQMYYADAIEVLLRNALYASRELRALEMELVRTSDLARNRPDLNYYRDSVSVDAPGRRSLMNEMRTLGVEEYERDEVFVRYTHRDPTATRLGQLGPHGTREELAAGPEESEESAEAAESAEPDASHEPDDPLPASSRQLSYYEFARQSLVRLYDYEVASSAPLPDQVRAFVQVADWDLLYSRNALAVGGYEQVKTWLEENGAEAVAEEVFAPQAPIVLPSFAPNPLVSEETEASTGYIDLAFRITKLGEPQRIEILDSTTGATEAAQEQLVRLVKASRFRPRVMDGDFRTSSVVVRYHLNDAPSAPEP